MFSSRGWSIEELWVQFDSRKICSHFRCWRALMCLGCPGTGVGYQSENRWTYSEYAGVQALYPRGKIYDPLASSVLYAEMSMQFTFEFQMFSRSPSQPRTHRGIDQQQ
jgi:hypothetical protein